MKKNGMNDGLAALAGGESIAPKGMDTKRVRSLIEMRNQRGFTLMEIVLVMALLVGLLGILVYNFGPFKEGQNQALCITNIAKVQQAMRSYAMMNSIDEGGALASTALFGTGKMLPSAPTCKSGGTYTYLTAVPAINTAYSTCSKSSSGHAPAANTIQ